MGKSPWHSQTSEQKFDTRWTWKKIAQRVNRLEDRFYAISNGMNLVGSWGIDDCECFASRSSDDDDGERTKEKETIIESSSELNWTEQNRT